MIIENISIIHQNQPFIIATQSRIIPNAPATLVFIHGLGCAKESFDDAFTAPALSGFSILTFDLPGFGASDKPENFSYKLEEQVEIVLKIIERFAPKQVVLIGHSMGGSIGTLVTSKLTNLVSYINVEGNFVPVDAGMVSRRTADQNEERFLTTGYDEFLAMLKRSNRKDFNTWATWYEKASRIAVYRASKSLVEWSDKSTPMNDFNILPKRAYIHGDEDDKGYLLKQFENVATFCIPSSGHFMMLDNSRAFYEAIAKNL